MPARIEIFSRSNPRLKELLQRRGGLFLFEGSKLVGDVLASGVPLELLIVTAAQEKEFSSAIRVEVPLWVVAPTVMAKISQLSDPPAVIAVVQHLEQKLDWQKERVIIALDRIQDPGNLGTIFRCAAAFGFSALALSGDGVQPNNSKFVRAAQSALLSVRFQRFADLAALLGPARQFGYSVYLTTPHAGGRELTGASIQFPALIIFGNEGQGLERRFLEELPSLRLEQAGTIESLNVAVSACIMMYELRRWLK